MPSRPAKRLDRPASATPDLVSELLRHLRVEASAMACFALSAPYHLEVDYGRAWTLTVTRGRCHWRARRGERVVLEQGDSIVGLNCPDWALASDFNLPAQALAAEWEAQGLAAFDGQRGFSEPLHLRFGGGGGDTELLGLSFTFEGGQQHPLIEALPAVFVVPRASAGDAALADAAARFLIAERMAPRPGYAALASHVAETAFLAFLRAHLLAQPETPTGWLRGLRDPRLAAALCAVHSQPAQPWTVSTMAQAAGLSRSAFAQRFTEGLGRTPMDYLASLRMHLARMRLAAASVPVSVLAEELGYGSERAFRAAFRRACGKSPREWRRTVES